MYYKIHQKPLISNPSWGTLHQQKMCFCSANEIHVSFGGIEADAVSIPCLQKYQYQCPVKQWEIFICRKDFDQVQELDNDTVFYVCTLMEECGYELFDSSVVTGGIKPLLLMGGEYGNEF